MKIKEHVLMAQLEAGSARAVHRTVVYGVRPYDYSAITMTGSP